CDNPDNPEDPNDDTVPDDNVPTNPDITTGGGSSTDSYGDPIPTGAGENIPLGPPKTGGAEFGLIYGLISLLGLAGLYKVKKSAR
ncbi:MAG TPA: hypothetical protein PKX46_05520, partial [Clostridia bacterium]|nr:hypothetical protein [Clostridia bacterium]